jgi:hypothetical protein
MDPWPYVPLALLVMTSCATPVPRPSNFYGDVPRTEMGLAVDLDLLATAPLSQDKKQLGEELLTFFHTTETSFENYIHVLEANIGANAQLKENYAISEAIIGGVTGISSPAIIIAAVAIPIAGAMWIAIGESVQHFHIQPRIDEARQSLEEARRISHLSPDIITAFRGLVFSPVETEADRRFMQWQAYINILETKPRLTFEN